jgi:hypothetical protein
MGKVGAFVTDPKAGAYCQVTLDNGEKILVNHDQGGFKGGTLTIEKVKWMGLSSDRLVSYSLESPEARAAMARLTQGVAPDSTWATPLGAFVNYVKDCKSVDDVRAKCAAIMAGH